MDFGVDVNSNSKLDVITCVKIYIVLTSHNTYFKTLRYLKKRRLIIPFKWGRFSAYAYFGRGWGINGWLELEI